MKKLTDIVGHDPYPTMTFAWVIEHDPKYMVYLRNAAPTHWSQEIHDAIDRIDPEAGKRQKAFDQAADDIARSFPGTRTWND